MMIFDRIKQVALLIRSRQFSENKYVTDSSIEEALQKINIAQQNYDGLLNESLSLIDLLDEAASQSVNQYNSLVDELEQQKKQRDGEINQLNEKIEYLEKKMNELRAIVNQKQEENMHFRAVVEEKEHCIEQIEVLLKQTDKRYHRKLEEYESMKETVEMERDTKIEELNQEISCMSRQNIILEDVKFEMSKQIEELKLRLKVGVIQKESDGHQSQYEPNKNVFCQNINESMDDSIEGGSNEGSEQRIKSNKQNRSKQSVREGIEQSIEESIKKSIRDGIEQSIRKSSERKVINNTDKNNKQNIIEDICSSRIKLKNDEIFHFSNHENETPQSQSNSKGERVVLQQMLNIAVKNQKSLYDCQPFKQKQQEDRISNLQNAGNENLFANTNFWRVQELETCQTNNEQYAPPQSIDPYTSFFILICQCAKINSGDLNAVIPVDLSGEWDNFIENRIAMNQWYDRLLDKLHLVIERSQ